MILYYYMKTACEILYLYHKQFYLQFADQRKNNNFIVLIISTIYACSKFCNI